MRVNAVIVVVLFVTLMVGSLLACYVVAVHRGDVQAWIPYISDLGLRGPEHFIFAQLLNMASYVGVAMMFLRFKTVASDHADIIIRRLKISSLVIGSLASLFMSFVANFPEGQLHGIGHVHTTGAFCLFTGGCVFMVLDSIITLRMQLMEPVDADYFPRPWWKSLQWYEWIQPIIATLSIVAWVLTVTGNVLSSQELSRDGNATNTRPHFWNPDEPGYVHHVQGAVCEWLIGILFICYVLLFLPEFRRFGVQVNLLESADQRGHHQPAQRVDQDQHRPGEQRPLLQH